MLWNIDPLWYNCPVLVEFLWFLSNYIENLSISLFLCGKVDFGCSSFVVQNWRIPPQNGNLLLRIEALHGIIILSLRVELNERSVLIIHSDSWIFWLIISPLVPLRPLVGLRPPSRIPSSVTPPHYACCISLCSVHDTTAEGVLSLCWCSLTLTLTPSMGIWHSAGVSKGVTTPAAHRGIWRGAGATKGVTSPAAHGGIWHRAGATKSWSSVVLLTCS